MRETESEKRSNECHLSRVGVEIEPDEMYINPYDNLTDTEPTCAGEVRTLEIGDGTGNTGDREARSHNSLER